MVDYKLRLGDGTTFSVDEKGLTTWLQGGLVDDKARVQPAGSKKWFTLKQVLAAQGEQRGHAVRKTEKGRADVDRQAAEETAEIERRVAEQRAAEERKAGEELAAAERKAAADRTVAERKLIEEREAAERWAIQEREEEEARLAAEQKAEQERVEAERRAAEERAEAERREAEGARQAAEAERREAEAREAERVAAAEAKVAAERAERAERKRKAEEARLEAEQRAAEAARLEAEKKAAEDARLAAERKAAQARVAQRKAEEERAAAARLEAEAREAADREAERLAEAERKIGEERAERAERKRRGEEERLAARRAAEEREAADRRAAAEQEARLPEPPPTEIAIEPAATMVKVEDFERELGLVPVMFDDGTGPAAGREPAGSPADRAPRAPIRERSDAEAALRADAATGVMKPPTAVDTTVMRLLKVLDRGVVWLVGTLKGLLARRATAVEPGLGLGLGLDLRPHEIPRVPVAETARPPVTPPAPERPRPVAPTAPTAPPPWAAPSVPPPRSQASAPQSKQQAAPQREAAVPPPSFQKMEVIPFAAAPADRRDEEDVWGGDDPWQEPGAMASAFSTAWRWTKRLTIAMALIATVAALALNQSKWMPQAQDAANVLGQNVDKLSERASVRSIPPERIEAARAEIPYLRAQTIELILLKSPGTPEPAEVFRRAHQAVETARPRLPDNVAAEIDNLMRAAAAGLDEAEGEKLRAYLDAMRAGTPTAVYQDKEAVWLMGRGARRLSAEQIARMEELFAQAVTAALQPPA